MSLQASNPQAGPQGRVVTSENTQRLYSGTTFRETMRSQEGNGSKKMGHRAEICYNKGLCVQHGYEGPVRDGQTGMADKTLLLKGL